MKIALRIMVIVATAAFAACGEPITPSALLDLELKACRRALPNAERPIPTWRVCGREERCFSCADDAGQLVPVRLTCRKSGELWFRDNANVIKSCDL